MRAEDVVLLFVSSFALGSASLTVEVLQGPGSRTTLAGPDGSALASAQPGGTVVTDGAAAHAGVVAASPALLGASPEIVVGGPAGRIITSHTLAGPAVVPAVTAPLVAPAAVAAPVVAAAASPAFLAGSAAALIAAEEGEYVPDNSEALYDDGSYVGPH